MKVVGLSGSLRAGSSNEKLLKACAALAPDIELSISTEIGQMPHFSPELDVEPLPAAVARFRAALDACDGVIVSCPEYAHGIPGSFKNALDWLVSTMVINNKPLLLISGGEYVHPQLAEVLQTMSVKLLPESLIARGRQAIGADGSIVDDELRARLLAGVQALIRAGRTTS